MAKWLAICLLAGISGGCNTVTTPSSPSDGCATGVPGAFSVALHVKRASCPDSPIQHAPGGVKVEARYREMPNAAGKAHARITVYWEGGPEHSTLHVVKQPEGFDWQIADMAIFHGAGSSVWETDQPDLLASAGARYVIVRKSGGVMTGSWPVEMP